MTRAAENVGSRPSSSPRPDARKVPPEWAIEKLIKTIGKVPSAAGKALDKAAKIPLLGAGVRFFSSVWLGITLLVLIGAYIAFGSGLSGFRASWEMTDLEFFDAVPMRVLLACLVVNLAIVTLRRIPLTLFKLGSWTVHIGIFTLIGGSVWYFSHKEEGATRLYLNKPTNYSYDVAIRALYAFSVNPDGSLDTDHPTITPLPGLPIYYEHGTAGGKPFEMTLASALPNSDATFRIVGYYPSAIMRLKDYRPGTADETGVGPAIAVSMRDDKDSFGQGWMLAKSPSGRVMENNLPCAVEYLYHPTAQRVHDLQTSFESPVGIALTVRVPKQNIDRVYPLTDNKPIAVEGTPYTLTPASYNQAIMPMKTPGYENALSTSLSVNVSRKDGDKTYEYQRMALFRYPELSADFVMQDGQRTRNPDGLDEGIEIIFHDATQPQAWIIEAEDGTISLITRTPGGKTTTQPLTEKWAPLPTTEVSGLAISLSKQTVNAVPVKVVDIIPPEQRPKAQAVSEVIRFSMIDAEISRGTWSASHLYIPFYPFADVARGLWKVTDVRIPSDWPAEGTERGSLDTPAVVEIPGANGAPARKVALVLSTIRRPMPSTLTLTKFEPKKAPGATRVYVDYTSTILAKDPNSSSQQELMAHLNNPATDHGIYYFQAAWDGHDNAPPEKRFSVLGVANRPGIYVMVTGAILIALGIGFAFYVKPLLLKAKKESLARWAKANS